MGNANAIGSGNSALTIDGGALNINGNDLNLPSLGGDSGSIANSGTTGTNTITVQNGNGNSIGIVIGDNPSGAKTRVRLLGSTELRFNATSTYSEGTYVASSAVLGIGYGAAGTGPFVLSNNATLYLHNMGGTSVFAAETQSMYPNQTLRSPSTRARRVMVTAAL